MRSGTRRNCVMAQTRQRQQNKAESASASAPYFLDGHWFSSLYRGATLPPKIPRESARALIPPRAEIDAASELFSDLSQSVPVLGAQRSLLEGSSRPIVRSFPPCPGGIASGGTPSGTASHGTYRLVARGGIGRERRHPFDRESGAGCRGGA